MTGMHPLARRRCAAIARLMRMTCDETALTVLVRQYLRELAR